MRKRWLPDTIGLRDGSRACRRQTSRTVRCSKRRAECSAARRPAKSTQNRRASIGDGPTPTRGLRLGQRRREVDRAVQVKPQDGGAPILHFDLHPYPFQREMLQALTVERERHGRFHNLVVAATGTGKTLVATLTTSSFDGPCRTRACCSWRIAERSLLRVWPPTGPSSGTTSSASYSLMGRSPRMTACVRVRAVARSDLPR